MKVLEYIKNKEESNLYANFFQMTKDLKLDPIAVATELQTLKDKGCVIVYEDGSYSLTIVGVAELKQLKGETLNVRRHE